MDLKVTNELDEITFGRRRVDGVVLDEWWNPEPDSMTIPIFTCLFRTHRPTRSPSTRTDIERIHHGVGPTRSSRHGCFQCFFVTVSRNNLHGRQEIWGEIGEEVWNSRSTATVISFHLERERVNAYSCFSTQSEPCTQRGPTSITMTTVHDDSVHARARWENELHGKHCS